MVTIMDATGLRLGRLASIVAKRSLQGEEIAIVNAEQCVVSGGRATVIADYDHKRKRGSREGGPFFPRRPDHIIKRTIRGMVPYKRARGADALRRVMVHVGVPDEFQGSEFEILDEALIDGVSTPKFVTLGEISTVLGAKF